MSQPSVFVTGGTGYLGVPLISKLLRHGYQVKALARPGSEGKLPPGCQPIVGDALDPSSYADRLGAGGTFVQLVGVRHPSPAKAEQFRSVDLVSAQGAVAAARDARVTHFIYLSVAQPAPVMKPYIQVRARCEEMIRSSGLNATILRPWYVLGPGHRWAYALLPIYALMELLPATRAGARRLGLVTLTQMVNALADAVVNPARGVRVVEVPEIRAGSGFSAKWTRKTPA